PRPVAIRTAALAGAALLAASAAAGCGTGPGAHARTGTEPRDAAGDGVRHARSASRLPARFTEQRLDWAPCTGPAGSRTGRALPPLPDGTKWECATLTAPLDYARPESGGTLKLAMVRAAAVRPGNSE